MKHLCDKKLCTGCLACRDACTKGAIIVDYDKLGFAYPHIDKTICVGCGICQKRCPIFNTVISREPLSVFKYKGTREERLKSASGAFFPLLAEYFLDKNYYICGVVYNQDFLSVKYIITKNRNDVFRMRKSKYISANLDNVFNEIKYLLSIGEKVLFVGLPCHCAGLIQTAFDRKNLVLVDMFCFGDGSPIIYENSMIDFINDKGHTINGLNYVDFRNKPCKFNEHVLKICVDDIEYILNAKDFPYYNGYCKALLFRESCYKCKFNSFSRVSDISFGDSTFIQTDDYGESVILCNTRKGMDIIQRLSNHNIIVKCNNQEVLILKKRFPKRHKPKIRRKIANAKNYDRVKKLLSPQYLCLSFKIKSIFYNLRKKIFK